MKLLTLRLNLTLTVVALYALLDAAFMLVRLPPGATNAVPIAEVVILLFVCTVAADTHLVAPFFRTVPIAPLTIWWLVGLTQLCIGVPQYGIWAMRDATSLIESSFLWIGFAVAAVPGAIQTIVTWFNRILVLSILITLTYPFRDILAVVSPVVTTTQNLPTPLFFTYHLPPAMSLVAALRLIVTNTRYWNLNAAWLAGALMIFVVALFQQRRLYLEILFIMGYLAVTRRGNPLRLVAPLTAAALVFVAILALGIPIPGRLSQNVSLDFYIEHFLAIGGEGNRTGLEDQDVRGAAGGVNQRFFWWEAIWDHVTKTWTSTMFGLGYGISLVGLSRDPGIFSYVREPHNSLISALGRTGFVGLGAYIWLQLSLALIAIRTYLSYRAKGFEQISLMIYLLGALFSIYWISAMAEDVFEKPYTTVTYYFFFGVILNLAYRNTKPSPERLA